MNDETYDKPQPSNTELERAVLGSILINNEAFWRVQNLLDVEDFRLDQHKALYRTIATLIRRGESADLLTAKNELGDAIGDAGGSAYISSLVDVPADIANVERYAQAVAEKGQLRRIIATCNEGMHRAMKADESRESARLISSAIATDLQTVSTVGSRESRPVHDVMVDVAQRKEERLKEGRTRVIATGFQELDYHQCIRRKALIIVGAPTSHGKTTFMLNLAIGAVEDLGVAGAIYSLEMSDEDVTDPLRSMLSGVRLQRIQDQQIDAWEERQVAEAEDWVKQRRQNFYFADRIRDIDTLYADCRKRKSTRGLDIVLIDYAQLVKGFDDARNRENEVDRIARHLLLMSQDLDCAVVAGSQVNKEREKRAGHRLSVMDLKYGSVIGEHARVVLMFQRPRQDDKSNTEIPWCRTVFQIEKNSGRRTGDVPMHADLAVQRFAEGDCRANKCRYLTTNNEPKEQELFG